MPIDRVVALVRVAAKRSIAGRFARRRPGKSGRYRRPPRPIAPLP